MNECVFCKIARKDIKSEIIYEDDELLAFPDLKPEAPVHLLVIPRKHIERISDIGEAERGLIGNMFLAAKRLAKEYNVESAGYRLVINCNKDAGQAVFHLHLHLLGGRPFGWPPG